MKKLANQIKDNYERFVTDLIGIRCLVLFKDDWENLHYYILPQFDNNVDYYIKDSILDFDPDEMSGCLQSVIDEYDGGEQ